ncbi:MAG: ABC transporter substrate-binding protein [Thermomicrobiales bacterium]
MSTEHRLTRRYLLRASAAGLVGAVGVNAVAAGAQDAGSTADNPLIGTLEGPEVVTDPAQFPTAFQEAAQLADLVQQGQLPPVQERIGQDPLVIKPVHEIGTYGGTWRRGFTGPGDKWNGWRAASGTDALLFWDYTGSTVVPNIAKGWEFSEDGRVLTIHLRRGMKWSDGAPFTADDVLFWFQDMYSNEELVTSTVNVMTINGKPGAIEKVDDHTVLFRFPDPYHLLPEVLAGPTALGGQASAGLAGLGGYAPAHYLKQFHPAYAPQEDLDRAVQEAGVDSWVNLFTLKNDWAINPDLPVLSPWKTTSPINTTTWTLERNPYSIWVDTDGNQLPYIDEVLMTLAENLEVLNLRTIAGEYDFQARHVDLAKLPVLLENQEQGGYKVYLDTGDYGSDMIIKFNLSFQKDPELARWFGTADFRRALSLGVERDQLNEIFWLGMGTPGSPAPIETNTYSPGPEYRTLWHTYDPERANAMLDEIGLAEKDGEGFRLRTDGQGRLRLDLICTAAAFMPYAQISEVIAQQWREIGIDLAVKEMERSAAEDLFSTNEHQLYAWTGDGSEHLFTFPDQVFPHGGGSSGGPQYGLWFQSGGEQGLEPPPWLQELYTRFRAAFGVPEQERIQLGKEIWQIIVDEVIQIGIVGLAPASMGVRVVKTTMGNIPSRQFNSPAVKNPSVSRPVTFFFKS